MIQLVEALLIGVFGAVTILYTFQTKVAYPLWLLQGYEHPWVFLLGSILALFVIKYSPRIGVMLLLLVLAVWMDGILFARDPSEFQAASNVSDEKPVKPHLQEIWPYDKPTSIRRTEVTGPALDNIPLVEPIYPTFDTPEDIAVSSGPAPFLI